MAFLSLVLSGDPVMQLKLEQTDRIVTVNGIPARVWEGVTGKGVAVTALITRIAVHNSEDASELEAELLEQRPATVLAKEAFSARLVL
jgi:hypothetical protein